MPATHKAMQHILLVEDNPASRLLMKEAFKAAAVAWELHQVENGTQMLAFLKGEGDYRKAPRPDLIVMDLNLPGKSGVELMDEIKHDEKLQDIPLVVLTGSNASADIQACSQFRCKYLLKPSRFHELVALVLTGPAAE